MKKTVGITAIISILLISAIAGIAWWRTTTISPLDKQIRNLRRQKDIRQRYCDLLSQYIANKYLDEQGRKRLDKVISDAKRERDRYRYGTTEYIDMTGLTVDFTSNFELEYQIEITRFNYPPDLPDEDADKLASAIESYDLQRQTYRLRRDSRSQKPDAKFHAESEKVLDNLRTTAGNNAQVRHQVNLMIKHFYD